MDTLTRNNTKNEVKSYVRAFLIFQVTILVPILISLFWAESIHKRFQKELILREFISDARPLMTDNNLLDVADKEAFRQANICKQLPNYKYAAQGIFEWRGHWEPIILDSPSLSDITLSPARIGKSFTNRGEILLYERNSEAIYSEKPLLYAASRQKGRLFLLVAELNRDYPLFSEKKITILPLWLIIAAVMISGLASLWLIWIINLLGVNYLRKVNRQINLGENEPPLSYIPGFMRIGELAIEHAISASQARREKRRALLGTYNDFEKERKDFVLVREVLSNASAAPDLASAAKSSLEPILRRTGGRCGAVFSIDKIDNMNLIGENNLPPDLANLLFETPSNKLSIQESGNEDLKIAINKIENIAYSESHPLKSLLNEGLSHCIVIPLKYEDDLWGIIHIYHAGHPNLNDHDRTLLKIAAREVVLALENKRLIDELDRKIKDNLSYYEISKMLISATDFEILTENILWVVHELLDAEYCSIWLLDEQGENLQDKASWGYPREHLNITIPMGKGITGTVAQTGQPILVNDINKDHRYLKDLETVQSEVAVPMTVNGKLIGVIDCESSAVGFYDEKDLEALVYISGPAAIAIERTRNYYMLSNVRAKDPLTKTYNADYFNNYILKNGEELLLRHGKISVAFINIHNLNDIVETYGDAAGDLVIKQTADMIVELFPEGIISHYRKNEFLVLLPAIGDEAMERLVERLHRKRGEWVKEHPEALPISFKAGYATATRFDELTGLIQNKEDS